MREELCEVCSRPVRVMSQIGTGCCSRNCERIVETAERLRLANDELKEAWDADDDSDRLERAVRAKDRAFEEYKRAREIVDA